MKLINRILDSIDGKDKSKSHKLDAFIRHAIADDAIEPLTHYIIVDEPTYFLLCSRDDYVDHLPPVLPENISGKVTGYLNGSLIVVLDEAAMNVSINPVQAEVSE